MGTNYPHETVIGNATSMQDLVSHYVKVLWGDYVCIWSNHHDTKNVSLMYWLGWMSMLGDFSTHWGRSHHFYGKHLFFPKILGYAYCSRFMHSIHTSTVLHSNINDMAGVERIR